MPQRIWEVLCHRAAGASDTSERWFNPRHIWNRRPGQRDGRWRGCRGDAGGWEDRRSQQRQHPAAFDADGGLDPGFGTQGVATPSFANAAVSCTAWLSSPTARRARGKRERTGISKRSGSWSDALTSTGAVDTTFGGGAGYVQPAGIAGVGRTVTVQSDGKIVVGIEGTSPDFIRLNSDGSTTTLLTLQPASDRA